MSRKEILQFFDDLSGEAITKENTNVIYFSLDKTDYVIDLSDENAAAFRELLAPYVKAGRKVSVSSKSPKLDASDVRRWAQANGYTVANRGKIPNNVIDAYRRANPAKA